MNAAILLLAIVAQAAPVGDAPTRVAPPPTVTPAETQGLVALARQAMHAYLVARTPAERVPVPRSLARIAALPNAVAVRLRRGGSEVAMEVVDRGVLVHSLAAAAQIGMRSPLLPDRVTREVLDGLNVSIEILGEPLAVAPEHLPAVLIPGLTGLSVRRGDSRQYLLPSTQYLLGLPASSFDRYCVSRLGADTQGEDQPIQRAAFRTAQVVGLTDGATAWLYRGKVLTGFDTIDANLLLSGARSTGAYLTRHQAASGRYGLPGAPASPAEHVRVLHAMLRLARARGVAGDGVAKALRHAMGLLREEGPRLYLAGGSPQEELAATAWMLLCLQELPPDPNGDRSDLASVRRRLADALEHELSPEALAGRLQPRPGADWLTAAYVAMAALAGEGRAERLAEIRRELAPLPAPPGEPAVWRELAGIGASGPANRVRPPHAVDEQGALGDANAPADTVVTALEALRIARGLAGDEAARAVAQARGGPQAVLDARRFCFQMIYHVPAEGWFTADPAGNVGAVRVGPAGGAVSLNACAAAVEALLGPAPPRSR